MSGALMNIGAVAAGLGWLWLIWDRNSTAPGWLFGGGLISLIAGGALS